MLRAFTRNYEDNSTEDGFQFTFYCDNCLRGFPSEFEKSVSNEKNEKLRGLRKYILRLQSLSARVFMRHKKKSAKWQKEHDEAFELAQRKVIRLFHRCDSCNRYLCDACFDKGKELCTSCALMTKSEQKTLEQCN